MTRSKLAVAVLCVAVTAAEAATPAGNPWMAASAIRADLIGHKLAGEYPTGIKWSEDIRADGTTDYEEAGLRNPGRWTLADTSFCFSYDAPLMGGCFRIVKLGSNCYELYVERDGAVTVPEPESKRDGVAWNGRMWRTTEPATCDEKPSV